MTEEVTVYSTFERGSSLLAFEEGGLYRSPCGDFSLPVLLDFC